MSLKEDPIHKYSLAETTRAEGARRVMEEVAHFEAQETTKTSSIKTIARFMKMSSAKKRH